MSQSGADGPLVSVIIPTFRRPANLQTAIASVLAQNYQNTELIVVDDNLPGLLHRRQTAEAVAPFTSLARLKYIQHEANKNAAAARNIGIRHARGEYIAFLDDDDVYYPDKIGYCLHLIQKRSPGYAAVYCGYQGWNSSANDLNRYPEGNFSSAVLRLDYTSHYMHTGSLLFRREAINLPGGVR